MNTYSTEKKDIRKFGLIAFLFFGTLFAVGLWRHKPLAVYLFGFLSTVGLGFVLLPVALRPVYEAWMKTAHFIGRFITAAMLTVIYYGVITPSGLLKRLFGGRPLPLSPDPEATTYWVTRPEPAQPKERFMKRF
jgi:hypothetical protein